VSYDLILPFFPEEIRGLLLDPTISDLMINGTTGVYADKEGVLERVGDENALAVRLDNGKMVELDPEKARHIDYGYTLETAKHVSADRILLTGESSQLAEQRVTLAKLNPNVHDLAIYTSDSIGKELELAQEGLSNAPSISNASESSGPSIEVEGYGIGL
jgi:hypothetical protein